MIQESSRMRGVFITGTDTDIGKTVLCGVLAACWGARYWKPIQAGVEPPTDSQRIAAWIGKDRVLPERHILRLPRSPNQAATREGVQIELEDFCLPRTDELLIVEGAGGVLVPINARHTMLDLMVHLGLPVIVAARSGLGTLNHGLMSVETLRRGGIEPLGIVLIGPEHTDNQRDLEAFGKIKVIGRIPWLDRLDPDQIREAGQRIGLPRPNLLP